MFDCLSWYLILYPTNFTVILVECEPVAVECDTCNEYTPRISSRGIAYSVTYFSAVSWWLNFHLCTRHICFCNFRTYISLILIVLLYASVYGLVWCKISFIAIFFRFLVTYLFPLRSFIIFLIAAFSAYVELLLNISFNSSVLRSE